MTDYDIQGPTRVCAATGRELKPGDRFFGVLAEDGGKFVRTDYAADAWPGPPAGRGRVLGRARCRRPTKPRKPVVNDDLLLDCFDRLKGSRRPGRAELPLRGGAAADAAEAVQVRGRDPRRRRAATCCSSATPAAGRCTR